MYIFLFLCNMLIPAIIVVFGYISDKKMPPMNGLVGYRTRRSMQSQEAWEFAHHCCGKMWLHISIVLIPVSIIASVVLLFFNEKVYGIGSVVLESLQCVVLIWSIVLVESELKLKFDQEEKSENKEV